MKRRQREYTAREKNVIMLFLFQPSANDQFLTSAFAKQEKERMEQFLGRI